MFFSLREVQGLALSCLLVVTLSAAAPLATPPSTIFPYTSNVFGRAQVNRSAGMVRYIGRHATEQQCLQACIGFTDPADGAICNSFTFHHLDYPSPDFAGACYAIADHSWVPVVDQKASISSGQITWPDTPCGASAATGCQWQPDPVCLSGTNIGPPSSMTPADAASACSASGGPQQHISSCDR